MEPQKQPGMVQEVLLRMDQVHLHIPGSETIVGRSAEIRISFRHSLCSQGGPLFSQAPPQVFWPYCAAVVSLAAAIAAIWKPAARASGLDKLRALAPARSPHDPRFPATPRDDASSHSKAGRYRRGTLPTASEVAGQGRPAEPVGLLALLIRLAISSHSSELKYYYRRQTTETRPRLSAHREAQ
jgi:hypothetical protein